MRIRKLFASILVFAVLFTYSPVSASESYLDPNLEISVGLLYGSNAVSGANAYSATGFQIGYRDANGNFVSVFTTPERFISGAKDRTLWVSGNTVSSTSNSGTKVGAYHVEITTDYPDQQSAQNKLEQVAAAGLPNPFIAFFNGAYRIRIDEFSTAEFAAQRKDAYSQQLGGVPVQVVGERINVISFLNMNAGGTLLFEFDYSGYWPVAMPIEQPGQNALIRNGTINYRGAFTFQRVVNDNVTLINLVRMQDYLKGVVPSEMPSTWPLEALKAQAVCARTYAYNSLSRHRASGFSVCATDHCQVYLGTNYERESTSRAVDETLGMVVTYGGKLAEVYFHSSNGGYTDSAQNVWGSTSYPYLAAVPDPYEDLQTAINGTWSTEVTLSELTQYFQGKGYDIGTLVDFYVETRTSPGGNVFKVTGVDTTGKTFSIQRCDNVRIAMNKYVKSPNFQIIHKQELFVNNNTQKLQLGTQEVYALGKDGVQKINQSAADLTVATKDGNLKLPQSDGNYIIQGQGWGHSVGMSQNGAKGMALVGMTYDQILAHYFPGTQLSGG